jgi:hypothetical protein
MKRIIIGIFVGCMGMIAMGQIAKYGETTQKGFYDSYISKDGTTYKIGDKLKFGNPQGAHKTFTYIQFGNVLSGFQAMDANRSGMECTINEFYVNGKNFGYQITFRMKIEGMAALTFLVQFENALESGEIIGFGMTSDQALKELKKYKEMYDLELITKDEYDSKKEELSKYIKN